MAFTSRRGRPKKQERPEADTGTPELRRKRQQCLTVEPLDWLREREIITQQQHWCGLHFRWLYTLRYGVATVQSLDAARVKGLMHSKEYEEWQNEREADWKNAVEAIASPALLQLLLNYCVYQQNIPTRWLISSVTKDAHIEKLSKCLFQLEKMWCKCISS